MSGYIFTGTTDKIHVDKTYPGRNSPDKFLLKKSPLSGGFPWGLCPRDYVLDSSTAQDRL